MILIFGLALVSAVSSQITWLSSPFAVSSFGDGTVRTVIKSEAAPKGSRFLYETDDNTEPFLVTVHLDNSKTGTSYELQRDFDPITQNCSCYYLDAAEQFALHKDLAEDLNYNLRLGIYLKNP